MSNICGNFAGNNKPHVEMFLIQLHKLSLHKKNLMKSYFNVSSQDKIIEHGILSQ